MARVDATLVTHECTATSPAACTRRMDIEMSGYTLLRNYDEGAPEAPARQADAGREYRLNLLCLRRLRAIGRIMFPSMKHFASLLFIIAVGLSLAEQLVVYNVGLIPSQFYAVLTSKPPEGFTPLVFRSLAIILVVALTKSLVSFAFGLLDVTWRRLITDRIHTLYHARMASYKLNNFDEYKVDNPDQRIANDVAQFTLQLATVFNLIVINPLIVVYYTYALWRLNGGTGPLAIYAYFFLGAFINRAIMSPLVALIFKKERQEGDFRFAHVQSRVHSESAAFYRGEQREHDVNDRRLTKLLRTQRRIVGWNLALNMSINTFDYVASIISYIIIGIPILAGRYDSESSSDISSIISKSSFLALYLLNAFTVMLDQATTLSDVGGLAHRIGELLEKLNQIRTDEDLLPVRSASAAYAPVAFEDVTFSAPDGRVLVRTLSFSVGTGEHLLITGRSGCGKTSLTRVLVGLWPVKTGRVTGPSDLRSGLMLLPQRPYMTAGSLADQLTYPKELPSRSSAGLGDSIQHDTGAGELDRRLLELLTFVGLEDLERRTGGLHTAVDWDWYTVLSQGELQRLAFARLLYHDPPFVVLDEATSALSLEDETMLYSKAIKNGMTLISVGHRASLRQFHRQNLHIETDGSWVVRAIAPDASQA